MSTNNLRLQVILQTIDKASAVLKKIQGGSTDAAKALKATRDKLAELNKTQKSVAEFRELRNGLKGTSQQLEVAQQKAKTLARGLSAVGPPTKSMIKDFELAKRAAAVLGEQHQRQSQQVQALRDRMMAAGISTRNLGTNERQLRSEINATTRSIEEQKAKLKQLAERQRAMQAASAKYHSGMGTAGNVAMKGAAAAGGGMAILHGLHAPIEESKKFQTETQRIAALGLGDKISADAVKFGMGMKTYGTSVRDNVGLVRDGLTVFADLHHAQMVAPTLAKMKFANQAMFGEEHGAENEKKFMDMLKVIEMRGGLASESKFKEQANVIQQVITATGGRVQGEEWLNVIKTGGIAAKGLTDKALYYQMEPLVQEMGGNRVGTSMMSAYSNVYQGKTTKRSAILMDQLGLIADPSKVKHDKVGQVSQLGVGALKGSEIFRENQFEWMEKILLPALAAKGITEKQQVLDAMGGIFSNRVASNLFAQMYLQKDQIHKNAALNAGADGVDGLYGKAKGTAAGNEIELTAQRADLYKALGDSIMPAYTKALEVATAALQGLTRFMTENPKTAQIMVTGLAAIAAVMIVIGGLMVIVAPMIATFVAMRYIMALAGIQGTAFSLVLRVLGGAMQWLGGAIMWVGRAMLMNPIGLAITAIAVAAFLIYKYWGPISQFFSQLWQTIKSIFNDGVSWVQQQGLRMYNAGADLMRGLANGITNSLGAVKDSIVGAGSAAIGWFKEKLGIHSPSRVFMAAGQNISDGAALGISSRYDRVRKATAGLSLAALGALPLATGAAPLRMDNRPPLSSASAGTGMPTSAGASTYTITIHAAPGMDERALARAVSAELDKRERQKRAASRSSLYDLN